MMCCNLLLALCPLMHSHAGVLIHTVYLLLHATLIGIVVVVKVLFVKVFISITHTLSRDTLRGFALKLSVWVRSSWDGTTSRAECIHFWHLGCNHL